MDFFVGVNSKNRDGILLGPSEYYNEAVNKMIFIYTNRKYTNGERLVPGYYLYKGVYDYTTVLGYTNSVHSFKEYAWDPAKIKDLYFLNSKR
jgi:hypothetical protein